MAKRDDDRFRPKVAPPKARGRGSPSAFMSRVLKATSRAGRTIGNSLGPRQSLGHAAKGKAKRFGRGQVAARLAGRALDARARRVAIKTRLVNLRKASARSTEQHLRYIERDGVTREGDRGQLFSAHTDTAGGQEFELRGRDDRHQFRVIVSPEDAHELGDLRAFARDLMSQVERDLGTRLEWIGVDHWDTDQPHIHLVIRGKDEHGHDLVIAPDYVATGMRARASELATSWLGRRSEREIAEGLIREMGQERWTSLDRAIQDRARDGYISLRDASSSVNERPSKSVLIGRLDRLADMRLVKKVAPLEYQLTPNMEATLRAMGERGDIIRTMQRAMGGQRREHVLFDHADAHSHIVGRVAGTGLADELNDRGYLIVDALDGRAHYVKLAAQADFTAFGAGAIVEVRGAGTRAVDRNIAAVALNGIYDTQHHLDVVRAQAREGLDADAYVQSHVRRLEALRRAGIVERIEQGRWRVPADFISRATAYDSERSGGAQVEVRSTLSLRQQTTVLGATWLDQQLVGRPETLATHGFGAEVRAALGERTQYLVEHQLAERRGTRVIFARDLLARLRDREVDELARSIERETGLRHRPIADGQSISGTYRRSFALVSGRFAMLDDGAGFSLVPWRPVIERRLGQSLSAVVRGQFVSWELGRTRGLTR
jgi:type IV secretory pathway VirD2 relaxase